jgi:hypothetical protein
MSEIHLRMPELVLVLHGPGKELLSSFVHDPIEDGDGGDWTSEGGDRFSMRELLEKRLPAAIEQALGHAPAPPRTPAEASAHRLRELAQNVIESVDADAIGATDDEFSDITRRVFDACSWSPSRPGTLVHAPAPPPARSSASAGEIIVSLESAYIAVIAAGPGGTAVLREFGRDHEPEELDLRAAAEEANAYATSMSVALGLEARLLPLRRRS